MARARPLPPSIFPWRPASIPMRPTRKSRNCWARTKTSTLWHPACGLIGFEPGDRRCVADLLQAPPERKTSWDSAKPGVSFSRRLTAIEPDRTPSAESVLREGQEDIGSRSSALGELPPGPGEPPAGLLARMAAAVKRQLTEMLQGPGRKPEEAGGKEQSPEGAAGQAAGESTGAADEAPGQHPGEATSVELVAGEGLPDVDSQSATAEKGPGSIGKLSAGLLGAMAGMARAARQGLARISHELVGCVKRTARKMVGYARGRTSDNASPCSEPVRVTHHRAGTPVLHPPYGPMQRLAQLGRWLRNKLQQPGRRAGRPPYKSTRKDEKLLEKRHRETLRLINMLETDPDRGLRYALPFNQGGHRGVAPPGSKLVHRDTDFNLPRLLGSDPVDLWHLPQDLREQLLAKYHELAGRELRLGRFRRAAYIYAELLGNIELAASALVTGRHWREAAVLYRDRLRRPDEAARCLEQGGLWTEAIALYEELGEHEKAGDLYRQLDQPDHARQAYRAAVAKHLAQNDCLAAARLLENKLDAPDEAIAQLEAGWPSLPQAGACLQELFQLLARLGRHEAAAAKIEQLRGQALLPPQTQLLIDIFSQTATAYPDAAVGAMAADATRTLAGAQLAPGDRRREATPAGSRAATRAGRSPAGPRLPPIPPSAGSAGSALRTTGNCKTWSDAGRFDVGYSRANPRDQAVRQGALASRRVGRRRLLCRRL